MAHAATQIAAAHGIGDVCVSGGVAYNDAIASAIVAGLRSSGHTVWMNERVPCGDGGVSFGQAAYAGRAIEVLEADRADAAPSSRGEQADENRE